MTGNTASFILANGDHQNVDAQFLVELHRLVHRAQAEFKTEMPGRPTLTKLQCRLAVMATDPNWGRLYADFWQAVCFLMWTNPITHGQILVKICLQTIDDRAHNLEVAPLDRNLVNRLLNAIDTYTQLACQRAAQPPAA